MPKSLRPRSSDTRFYRRTVTALALSSFLFLQLLPVVHAVNLNTVNTAVTQNFDTIGTSATATLPTDFRADKQTTAQTVGSYASAVTATEQRAGNNMSSTATNGIYNYAAGDPTTATERAVGFISSSSATKSGNLYAKYTNSTGAPLSALRISYDVERYRNGSNSTGFRFQLFYSTDGTTWTNAGSNFLTSFTANADNNGCATAPCETKSVSNQVLSIPTIASNSDIYLAWNYSVATGTTTSNAQGLGIDNISVTPLGSSVGAAGVRTTDIQGTDDGGYAMVLQPDGKIVVGGYAVNGSGNKDFALVRYNYDGTLDTTFNGTGKVTTDFNGTSDRIWGITLQTDGKIIAVGETVSAIAPGTNDIAIARYNTDGTLDATFGGTGKVTTDHTAGANNSAYAVAMQGTNIIVAGTENVSGNLDFMIARYTNVGLLDPTFGTLGVTTQGFSGGNDVARAVAIDSSSRIVVGGYSRSGGGDDDFAIARFTSTGTLDTTFVSPLGMATLDLASGSPGSADQAFGLAIDSSQRIILVGSTFNTGTGNKDFAVVRYLSTGALDTGGFGGGTGIVTTDFVNSPDIANAVYVRSDGFIVVGGFARFSASSDDFALARYNASGALDTTFDGDGKLTMRIDNGDERAYAVAQEFDGKIVAAGFSTTPSTNPVQHDFAVARFNADGSLDATSPTALTSPDLLLTKSFSPASVTVGGNSDAIISVTNRGPGNATNVVVTDTIPAGLTIGNTNANPAGTVQVNGQTITYTVGPLAAGQSAMLTVTLTTTQTGTFINTASVTSTETDLSPGNNTDSATLKVTPVPTIKDLSFSPSTVVGGCQNSTGTVTLTAPAPGNGVMVNISSGDPAAASAPAQVLVPGGQTSAQFTVTTGAVQASKQVRFEATYNTSSFVRRLVVNAGSCD